MGSNAKILSLEDTSIPSLLAELYKTNVLIGMHGSALIFSIFLPPKAGVIELFPYGVPPEHYTPYKTLTKLAGMDLQYASWRNHNRDKTITHPDWLHSLTADYFKFLEYMCCCRPRHLGGIAHLPHDIQEKVKGQIELAKITVLKYS
eukprot:m.99069 g.99069  ORF g.99069 m.99069 type:complete len:147 (+) comp13661_c1_seq3:577-1017(+)